MSTAKQAYRALCNSEPSIPVFSKAWWLDAAAGSENWDVVIVEREGEIVASLPFVIKRLLGITLLTQPSLTQTLGPWLKPTSLKSSKLLSWEKEQMQALIAQLPPYSHYVQQWHYSYSNWLPFYWKGFTQTTRYTFVIDDLSDIASVYAGFSHAKRYEIRKAEKHIRIAFDLSAEEFYENHKMALALQRRKISYSFSLFKKLYETAYRHDAGRTIAGYDKDGNLHAALFVVWDANSAYGLISTIDPRFRGSGAPSLLIREIIRFVSPLTTSFDFEGSMTEDLARSYRQFSTQKQPYFRVSRTPSKLYATAKFLRSMISTTA
ncbi:GNAT family N-acetyltransferase [Allopusillimonas ginsengisoli]|uniref:GNAT family N-acetyltransferase n=1 Tax=Allopusillimonas ginsengisoli TaxID=453575 RepID=UPI0010205AFB|nr:GNAT family N-acetyltransferase [Allopusillimonas ginsengisoli]TEA78626.1 GNAT family N-acetyltransferase [Allopusillimonas ginsengisoli]